MGNGTSARPEDQDDAEDPASCLYGKLLKGLQDATRTGREDVSFFLERSTNRSESDAEAQALAVLAGMTDFDPKKSGRSFDIDLQEHGGQQFKSARLQVSSAGKGKVWSVTARVKYATTPAWTDGGASLPPLQTSWQQEPKKPGGVGSSELLCSLGLVTQVLSEQLALRPADSGLVIVAGQTGSGKSELLRGLIHLHLAGLVERQMSKKDSERRNPHVLTFEDPIETPLFDQDQGLSQWQRHGVDYTPRLRGVDARDLREVTHSALRQKPALLFVGEVRDDEDLQRSLDFAGTGHLVFATTHAGSLLETMQRLLNACKAHDPGTRAIWVPKIRAAVHLKSFPFKRPPVDPALPPGEDGKSIQAMLPAVYVNSALAQHALVADGLAALLPFVPTNGADPPVAKGAFGRRYFVDRLRVAMLQHVGNPGGAIGQAWREAWTANANVAVIPGTDARPGLEALAINADLNGE